MDPASTEPGSDDPIGLCRRLLAIREFSSCRKFALMARESNPNSLELSQILPIVDVLLAAQRRTYNERPDYYSILQLTRPECENGSAVLTQSKKLLKVLSPSRNKFPFSDEAFNLVCDAWSVLSKPEKKKKYDLEIKIDGTNGNTAGNCGKRETHLVSNASRVEDHKGKKNKGTKIERDREHGTFWTVCPYCCMLYEYAIVYEECCLRCQSCRRTFHGLPVGPLPETLVAEGVDKYYCGLGFFRFGYDCDGFFVAKENNGFRDAAVNIPNDSNGNEEDNKAWNADPKKGEKGEKLDEEKEDNRKREALVFGRLNGRRVKTTARNTKKGMRMEMKRSKVSATTAGESSSRNDNVGNP